MEKKYYDNLSNEPRGSFKVVWASTASRFINGYDLEKPVDLILLQGDVASGTDIDALYITTLEYSGFRLARVAARQ
jgi:hypothetical protein